MFSLIESSGEWVAEKLKVLWLLCTSRRMHSNDSNCVTHHSTYYVVRTLIVSWVNSVRAITMLLAQSTRHRHRWQWTNRRAIVLQNACYFLLMRKCGKLFSVRILCLCISRFRSDKSMWTIHVRHLVASAAFARESNDRHRYQEYE